MAAAPGRAFLRDGALWTGGVAFALALHAGIAWWGLRLRADPPLPSPPPGAIAFALQPLPAAPAIPASAPVVQEAAPPRDDGPSEAVEPEPPVEDRVEIFEAPPVVVPAVTMPRPRPADLPPLPATERPAAPRESAAPAAAPSDSSAPPAAPSESAATSAAPRQGGSLSRPQVSPQRYEAQLLAHLERNKTYPRAARVRGEQGVVRVAFAIDRTGLVTGARVTRSSGSAVLDRAALDTLRRASPVPAPPAEMRPLSFSVPMTFALR